MNKKNLDIVNFMIALQSMNTDNISDISNVFTICFVYLMLCQSAMFICSCQSGSHAKWPFPRKPKIVKTCLSKHIFGERKEKKIQFLKPLLKRDFDVVYVLLLITIMFKNSYSYLIDI